MTYPEVRHVLPDRISLAPDTDPRVLELVTLFVRRQQWLVSGVTVE